MTALSIKHFTPTLESAEALALARVHHQLLSNGMFLISISKYKRDYGGELVKGKSSPVGYSEMETSPAG